MVIMQRVCHLYVLQAIQRRIVKRLYVWEADHHQILVKETARTCNQYLSAPIRDDLEEQRVQAYHRLLLQGNLWMPVRGSRSGIREG